MFYMNEIISEYAERFAEEIPNLSYVAVGDMTLLPALEDAPDECMVIEPGAITVERDRFTLPYLAYRYTITFYYCRKTNDSEETAKLIMGKAREIGRMLWDWSTLAGFKPDGLIKYEEGWPSDVDFKSEPELFFRGANVNLSVVAITIQPLVVSNPDEEGSV